MIFHFSKKTYLADLIPANFVDIHSHLLPGIDDGAKNLEHTASLLKKLTELGIGNFITTPHIIHNVYDNNRSIIESVLNNTKAGLAEKYEIRVAAEYMLDSNFLSHVHEGNLLTLKNNEVLIEMSYLSPPIQLYDFIFDLQIAGYVPVLAHPERYSFYHHKLSEFTKLKNAGCQFQLNLLSCTGYYGKKVTECAEQLLKSGLINFVGSDVHHHKHIEALSSKLLIKDNAPLRDAMQNNLYFQ